MARASTWLLDHKRDFFSQTGEDGIIEKILATLPGHDKWCVEFGAWDGRYLTNTRHLIESAEYSAVLIEADRSRFGELRRTYADRDNVIAINAFVGFGQTDNLDCILATTPIPIDFDMLSIDIDGNDYHVWNAVSKYMPKMVVIEFNPTIPTQIRFVQPADPSINQGASLLSIVELAKEKGYELVCALMFNAFFVRREYYPLFQIGSNAPEVLRTDLSVITHMFSGYDGKIFLFGNCSLPWHKIRLKESRFQYLPALLRHHPEGYTRLQRVAFKMFKYFLEPERIIKRILRIS